MITIPNVISLTRLPLSAAMVWLAVDRLWFAAFVVFAVAMATDAIDGWLARWSGWESDFGRDVLEPVCDLVMSGAAIFSLCWTGVWSWWALGGIVAVAAVLQLISFFGDRGPLMRKLKRHQYYLHPAFFIAVVVVAFVFFAALGASSPPLPVLVGAVTGLIVALKHKRISDLLAGPPATQ